MKTSLLILAALLSTAGNTKTIPSLLNPKGPAHFPLFCADCYNEPLPGAQCRDYCGCTSAFCGRW